MPRSNLDVELVIPAAIPPAPVPSSATSPVPTTSPAGPPPPSTTALPRTGSEIVLALLLALTLLVLGALLIQLGRTARAPFRRSS